MRKRTGLVLFGLMLAVMFASNISVVNAHSPGPMTLEYDTSTDILTVTVTHSTADVNTHYIYEIVIEKNSVQVDIATYTSQSSASQVVETFTITAVAGDVLEATAKCSVSGQISNEITVTDPETTTDTTSSPTTTATGTTDPMILPLLIGTAVVVIGVVFVIVVVIKRR